MTIPVSDGTGATQEQAFLIGDSIGVQLQPHLSALAKRDGILFKGAPIGGWRVQTWVNNAKGIEIVSGALAWPTTTFIVVLGTNDVLAGAVPDMASLVKKLRVKGASVIWIGPGKLPHEKYQSIENDMAAQAKQLGIAYIDTRQVSVPMLSDKIHPSPAGAKQLAAWLWPRIKPNLLLAGDDDSTWLRLAGFVAGAVTFFALGSWVIEKVTTRRPRQ